MTPPVSNRPFPLSTGALGVLGVLFASICFGLVPYFSRGLTDQGMAPHAVAFYRFVLAAVLLAPVLLRCRDEWRTVLWGIAAGAVMGVGWVGYVRALGGAPVSTVGVLYMTYPVFTVAIAWALFGDRPSARGVFAALLIVLAAILASSPAAIATGQIPLLVISLAAPFGFGFGICVLVHKLARIAPLARIASVSLGSVIGLAPLMAASGAVQILPEWPGGWLLVAGIGLATALIPQLVYTICSPLVGAARTAVIGSVELPMMFLVGVLAFGERVNAGQALGCAIVVGAIVLSGSRATRNVATNIACSPDR